MSDADNVTPGPGHNTRDWAEAEPFIQRFENLQDQIDGIMAEAREKCAPLREDQKQVKTEAADAGFRKQPFAGVIRERKHIRKANAIRAKLHEEQQEDYDQIKNALGMLADLPLGEAVTQKAA